MKPIRTAIVGTGFMGRVHLEAVRRTEGVEVAAIVGRTEDAAQRLGAGFGVPLMKTDYREVLRDRTIDAVHVCTPNAQHYSMTKDALELGKHVLCEKPLAMSAAECNEMITACQQANVLLMEAVMYRFHPRMLYLKQVLVARELGDARFLHAAFSFNFNAPDNYRAYKQFGGGALLDVGSYCVNAARWLIGSEPESSQGIIAYNQNSIDLSTSAILRFSENVSAHIQSSFVAAEYQVIEVVGTTGAVLAPVAFTAWRDEASILLIQRGTAFEQKEFAPSDPYKHMVEHFAACVLKKTPLLYPAEDAWANLRVLDILRDIENAL